MTGVERFDNQVRVSLYRLFVERGHAPVPVDVARDLDASVAEVEAAFRRLAEEHVIVLAPGTPYIWMANPLSALPTPYAVDVDGKRLWANCVWDAFGILAMLDSDGRISAGCADCGDKIEITVTSGALDARDLVVHYAVPAAHWWDDIGFN